MGETAVDEVLVDKTDMDGWMFSADDRVWIRYGWIRWLWMGGYLMRMAERG